MFKNYDIYKFNNTVKLFLMKRIYILLILLFITVHIFTEDYEPIYFNNIASRLELNFIMTEVETNLINLEIKDYVTIVNDIRGFREFDPKLDKLNDYSMNILNSKSTKLYITDKDLEDYRFTIISDSNVNIINDTEVVITVLNYYQSEKKLVVFLTNTTNHNISKSVDQYKHIIDKTFINLHHTVESMDSEYHVNILESTISKYLNNELPLQIIDEEVPYLSSARFSYLNSGEYQYIELNKNIFDLYNSHQTLFEGIFLHELFHAYIYFKEKDYIISVKDNNLEEYLYEMDALNIESRFYIAMEHKEMSSFEKYMVDSFKSDNLRGASFLLKAKDQKLIYHLLNYKNNYVDDKISLSDLLDEVIGVGHYLISLPITDEINWKNYSNICSLMSYSQHITDILNPLLNDTLINEYNEKIIEINSIKNNIDINSSKYISYIQSRNNYYLLKMEPILNDL